MLRGSEAGQDDRSDHLLRLAMDLSDGKSIDWVAESEAHPELRDTLGNVRAVASVAEVCASLTSSPENPTRSVEESLEAEADEHDTEMPKTWGHLQILEKLGEGRFGVVYRAHDPNLDIDVALKLLHPSRCSQDRDRFLDEARRLAKVRHPNVVTVHGADVHDGRVGLWTDLLVGQTLEERLEEHGAFSAHEAVSIGVDLCRALAAVHKEGLVHNDVKATNVMRIDDGGRNVLLDFGCVRQVSLQDSMEPHLYGTPVYMSPEVMLGEEAASRASDVYALGVLLYHVVTKAFPVTGASFAEIISRHRNQESVRLLDRRPDLPRRFVEVVERALRHDSHKRYASAGEMERALVDTLRPVPLPWWHAPRLMQHKLPIAASLSATILILVVLWGAGWWPFGSIRFQPQVDVAVYRLGDGMEQLNHGARVRPGDQVLMQVEGEESLHFYVFNAAEKEPKKVNLLFPTDLDLENPLPGGSRYQLPGREAGNQAYWTFSTPGGKETLLLVAARKPLEQLESRFASFNRVFFHNEVTRFEVDPEKLKGLRGINEVIIAPDSAATDRLDAIARDIEKSGGGDVWLWRLDVECLADPEASGAGQAPHESGSEL